MRSLINFWGKSVRAADNEYQPLGRDVLLVLNPCGEFSAAELLAALIEQHYAVSGLQRLEYEVALLFLLLRLAKFLGILQFGYHRYVELCKMSHPLSVVLYSCCYVVVDGAADYK